MNCKICTSAFGKNDDVIYLCEHKEGFVHQNCCINNCSWDRSPCVHKVTTFMNIEKPKSQ